MRLTLASITPDREDTPRSWDVRFDAELSDGSTRHCPVTVYASRLSDTSRTSIIAAADAMVRPGLVIEETNINRPPAPAAPDWFDTIPTKEE